MPGAREAVEAVQAAGGRAIVVTAKHEPNAKLHLAHLGIEPDAVIGWLWAEAKAEALREYGASVYVGDHVGDVRGARTAGALSVAVPTGPCDAADCGRPAPTWSRRPARRSRPGWRSGPRRGPSDELARRATAAGRARTRASRRWPRPSAARPRAAIRKPTPISMHTAYAYGGNGSVPRNSGATVTSVATAPTKKTMAPARTSRSPGAGFV